MKHAIAIAAATLSLSLSAKTMEEAIQLFQNRGEDHQNAKKAADIFNTLAQDTRNQEKIATLKTEEARALYYFAGRLESNKEKEKVFKLAYEAADQAIVKLTGKDPYSATPIDENKKSELALAHYFSAINMGKWAQARGVLASLGQWKFMKKHLEAVVKNDQTVENYGAARTYGRAYMNLPFTHGGSNKKALKNLRESYDNTINEDFGTSTSTTTTVYYLDILSILNKTDTFCEVYDTFSELTEASDEDLQELNPNLVPEAKKDIENFDNSIDFEKDIHEYAETFC